jgi:uncharacterized integral membrane protein
MARHQVSATETSTSEHVRLTGPRDAASPRRDALAQPGGSSAPRSRLNRTWLAAGTVAVVLVLLIIFIAQNTESTNISFLGLSGALPLAAALLAAALAGALLAATVATARGARRRRRGRD